MDSVSTVAGAQTNAAAGIVAGEEYGRKLAVVKAEIQTFGDGRPYRVLDSGTVETVERVLRQPTFRRGQTEFYEALSFSRFVKRFRNHTTVIFADPYVSGPRFTAVLDYHPAGEGQAGTQWDFFRATLPLRHTPSWATWFTANGKQMEQAEFAQFLEDNIPDIAEPAGALLVEIARTLEANVDVSFQSHIRADNGSHRFGWVETVTGTATSAKDGKVEIPAEVTLLLQPFEGSKQYAVKARLRYRLAGGKVKLGFELVRMQDVLKEAFNDELAKIDAELNTSSTTDSITTPIYHGPAPSAQQPKD